MNKKILWLSIVIILCLLMIYVFIPSKLEINLLKEVNTNSSGFDSCLHNLKKWNQWWPEKTTASYNDSSFIYNDYTYKLKTLYTNGTSVQISKNNQSMESRIITIFKQNDSIIARWYLTIQSSLNPITRVTDYLGARKLKNNMNIIFDSLCHFTEKTENVYGFHIERTTFTEDTLITYRFRTAVYPTTDDIYTAIKKLRNYLISQGAVEKYYPLTNTKQVDSSLYESMIAISINKKIPTSAPFFMSQMITMKDRFLTTDVIGGPAAIAKAHQAIENYMANYSLSPPARPFDILITDRSQEKDSSVWKTKIFYPSM